MISSIFDQFSLPKRNTNSIGSFYLDNTAFPSPFLYPRSAFLLLRIHHLFIFGPLHQVKRGTLPLLVHKDNRKDDIFKCLKCGHTDHADRVAAINLRARYYTSKMRTVQKCRVFRHFEETVRSPQLHSSFNSLLLEQTFL